MRIKIIKADSSGELEELINKFLEELDQWNT